MRIPSPYTTGELWWPPPQPNLALQMHRRDAAATLSSAAKRPKGTYIEARDRRILEDNRRQIAEAEQRQREFEKQREAAEMAKIKEADHMGRAAG